MFPTNIGKKTFGEAYAQYFSYISNRVKQSTLYTYESCYNSVIKTKLGNMALSSISPVDITKFLSELNFSYKYKSKIRALISSVFKYMVKYYDFPSNPVAKTDSLRRLKPKKVMVVWSTENFNDFIKVVDDIVYKTLFTLLYTTGLRRGETMALEWSDIDFPNSKLTVSKTYTRKTKQAPYVIENSPKTDSSNRTISISNELCKLLLELRSKTVGSFIFNGKSPIPETTLNRKLKAYINKANSKNLNVPEITYHAFRHSHASYLLSNGVSIVAVSKRLGHSNVTQTLNTYAHLMKTDEEQIMSLLNLGTKLGTKKCR